MVPRSCTGVLALADVESDVALRPGAHSRGGHRSSGRAARHLIGRKATAINLRDNNSLQSHVSRMRRSASLDIRQGPEGSVSASDESAKMERSCHSSSPISRRRVSASRCAAAVDSIADWPRAFPGSAKPPSNTAVLPSASHSAVYELPRTDRRVNCVRPSMCRDHLQALRRAGYSGVSKMPRLRASILPTRSRPQEQTQTASASKRAPGAPSS